MSDLTRRGFMGRVSALAGAAVLVQPVRALAQAPYGGFRMGSQSYSFRQFKLDGALRELKRLGLNTMEFCSVHFPADASDPGFEGVKQTLAKAGVNVPCFGVEGFGGDAAANRKKFEFAKALGCEIITADPAPESFDNLDELTAEFNIKIGIHNHGPGHRYDKVDDTLRAVEKHSPMIGACLDTGHCLRSGEKPAETIAKLGARLHSLHLKDWILNGPERIVGEGQLDPLAVAKALKALDFKGPIMLEYELSPGNPAPDMIRGLENWAKAVSQA